MEETASQTDLQRGLRYEATNTSAHSPTAQTLLVVAPSAVHRWPVIGWYLIPLAHVYLCLSVFLPHLIGTEWHGVGPLDSHLVAELELVDTAAHLNISGR